MYVKSYDVFVSKVYGQKVRDNPSLLDDLYRLLPLAPSSANKVAFGIDLGYTEPTVISVLYQTRDSLRWYFVSRIIMYQVAYPIQRDFIAKLDYKYNPDFIGIDAGGPGKSVVQELCHDKRYDKQALYQRVIAVDFQANVSVGYDADGNELKERAKVYGVQKLQEMANNHRIAFSSADDDVITELERTVYSRSPSGNIIYRTLTERGGKQGDDHNLASLISFMLAWYEKYDAHNYKRRRKKLRKAMWL
jgi:hypothetical protein